MSVGNYLKQWSLSIVLIIICLVLFLTGWVYNHNPFYSRGDNLGNFKIYDIFKVGIFNGEYLSEDYFFCKLCRKLGYKVYVDLFIKVRHNGMLPIEIK